MTSHAGYDKLSLSTNAVKRKSRRGGHSRELPDGARQRWSLAELALEQPAEGLLSV